MITSTQTCHKKITKAGICLADITDHLPVYYTVRNRLPLCQETKYFRDFSHFDKDLFLSGLENMDFNQLINADVNESINNVVSALQTLSDKHATVKKLSSKKIKQSAKPWLSDSILKSIRRRQQLFKTHFLGKDLNKVKFYKAYNNKLNRLKDVARKRYFQEQFKLNSENLKATFKLIGMIVNSREIKLDVTWS